MRCDCTFFFCRELLSFALETVRTLPRLRLPRRDDGKTTRSYHIMATQRQRLPKRQNTMQCLYLCRLTDSRAAQDSSCSASCVQTRPFGSYIHVMVLTSGSQCSKPIHNTV